MQEFPISYTQRQPNILTFAVNLDDVDFMSAIRFIVHVKEKYRADITYACRYHGESGDAFASIELEFPSLTEAHDAKQLFRDKIDGGGRVKADFVSIFERSDPKAMTAKSLMRGIEAEPFSN